MKNFLLFLLIAILLIGCQQGRKEVVGPLPKALSYLQQGNPWRAFSILTQVQDKFSDRPSYWYLRGQAALRCGNLTEAIKSLEIAVSLAPDESRYLIKLGYLYVITNRYQKAQDIAKTILKNDPKNPYAHLILGQIRAFSGKIKEAKQELELAIAAHPSDYQLYLDMGDLYLLIKDFLRAEELYRQALNLKPQSPEVYLSLANLFLVKREYNKAEENIQKAIDCAQEKGLPVINYQAYLAEFYLRINEPEKALALYQELNEKKPSNYFYGLRLVEVALKLHRLDLAREVLSRLEKKFPELFEIPYLWGHLALLENRYKDAIGYFSQAASMSEDPRAFYYLGVAQWLSGFSQQARLNLKKAITKDPMLIEASFMLAALELEDGDPILAEATLLDLLPFNPRAHRLALVISLVKGDCERAHKEKLLLEETGALWEDLENAFEFYCLGRLPQGKLPLQAWIYFREDPEALPRRLQIPAVYSKSLKIALLWEHGDFQKARDELARLRGQNPVLLYLRAFQAWHEGEKEAALVLLEEISQKVSFFPAEVLRGEIYLAEEEYEKAAEAFRKALLISPKDPLVLNNLAWVLALEAQRQGVPPSDEALTVVEKALEIAPEDPAVLHTVAFVYHLAGMKEVSCRKLRQALELAPQKEVLHQDFKAWCL